MAPFDRLHTSAYWDSTLTIAMSCIVSEIKRDIGQKLRFFIRQLHSRPPFGSAHWNVAIAFGTKTRMVALVGLPGGEKSLRICLLVLIQYTNVTDRRTDTAPWQRPRYAQRRAAEIINVQNCRLYVAQLVASCSYCQWHESTQNFIILQRKQSYITLNLCVCVGSEQCVGIWTVAKHYVQADRLRWEWGNASEWNDQCQRHWRHHWRRRFVFIPSPDVCYDATMHCCSCRCL